MKGFFLYLIIIPALGFSAARDSVYYRPDHPSIRITGRVDRSNPLLPRFWAPGVYVEFGFQGSYCILEIRDEERWGKSHNYLEIKIDQDPPFRIQTKSAENRILIANGLKNGPHQVLVCKNTEAEIGYLELQAIVCEKILAPPPAPKRSIEFYGNSITCGMGNDPSAVPCNTRDWFDQHNAFMAYGPLLARNLGASWQLTSVSGIGLMHSCCNKNTVMPDVYDKINLAENKLSWNFSRYQPDLVTVCLGQNDGVQDSATFCKAYVDFMLQLRKKYPKSRLLMLNSPMADDRLEVFLRSAITTTLNEIRRRGDKKISAYFFDKKYRGGCDAHPSGTEHLEMATLLEAEIRLLMNW